MRSIVMAIWIVIGLIGCTKEAAKSALCDTGKTIESIVSAQIAVQLDCKNIDAIKADIDKKLVEFKICETPPVPETTKLTTMSDIGLSICKPVIDGLAAGLVAQIPPAWGCTGGKLTDDAKAKLIATCSKAI